MTHTIVPAPCHGKVPLAVWAADIPLLPSLDEMRRVAERMVAQGRAMVFPIFMRGDGATDHSRKSRIGRSHDDCHTPLVDRSRIVE